MDEIKTEIMRRPFQMVAKEFEFHADLVMVCLNHLAELTYNEPISSFSDYPITRNIKCTKFLVTTGFTKLQLSKIDNLGIKNDFKGIFIVDPSISSLTKKDIFKEIIKTHNLQSSEVLVVGDDLNSEIKSGKELGIKTVLYDFLNQFEKLKGENVINNYKQLSQYI